MLFAAILESFENTSEGYYFLAPEDELQRFKRNFGRYVMCKSDGDCSMRGVISYLPSGIPVIRLTQQAIVENNLKDSQLYYVTIRPHNPLLGVALSEQFSNELHSCDDASSIFYSLSPGSQRSLAYFVDLEDVPKGKEVRAKAVVKHLIEHKDDINFQLLSDSVNSLEKSQQRQ